MKEILISIAYAAVYIIFALGAMVMFAQLLKACSGS